MINGIGNDPAIGALIYEGFRLVILIALPLTAAVFVSGLLAAAVQGFTRIHDHVIGYTLRGITVCVAGIIIYPYAIEGVSRLIGVALKSQ